MIVAIRGYTRSVTCPSVIYRAGECMLGWIMNSIDGLHVKYVHENQWRQTHMISTMCAKQNTDNT